jgi:hypothetical protein
MKVFLDIALSLLDTSTVTVTGTDRLRR